MILCPVCQSLAAPVVYRGLGTGLCKCGRMMYFKMGEGEFLWRFRAGDLEAWIGGPYAGPEEGLLRHAAEQARTSAAVLES